MTDEIAIVIPALNEADNIGLLLDDCAEQTLQPSETIVVDAGSTDGTREVLAERQARWPAMRVLQARGGTPGRARNEGVRHSRSPLIATLDAGSRVGPEWLATLSAPLRALSDDAVCVGVAEPDPRSEFERAAGWFTLRSYKPPGRRPPLSTSFLPAGRNGFCFSRRSWNAVGGYPEHLAFGEDKVFVQRLRRAGWAVTPVREATVQWRPRSTLVELYRQYQHYGYGDAVAGLERQNEVIPMLLYSTGAALSLRAARGNPGSGALLALGAVGYLTLFVWPARRELGCGRALAWVAPIRVAVDVAKMHGFMVGLLRRLSRAGG
jgi:glycosyltransferase involved in cell wall biosynthesis